MQATNICFLFFMLTISATLGIWWMLVMFAVSSSSGVSSSPIQTAAPRLSSSVFPTSASFASSESGAEEYPVITEAENFHGFHTVHFYESECRRLGQTVRRLPCAASDGTQCIVLVNVGASADGIDIITADEKHCMYSGGVLHGEGRLESLLSRLGYTLTDVPSKPAPAAPQLYEITTGELTQYSLFA